MNTITVTPACAQQAMAAFVATHRTCRVVGWGDPPPMPYYQNGWSLDEISRSDLESTTCTEVLRRLEILEDSGVKYTHILIAHEDKPQPKRLEIPKKVVDVASDVLPLLGETVAAVGAFVGVMGLVLARVLLIAVLADPVVIVVIQPDNPFEKPVWLEIAKWYD